MNDPTERSRRTLEANVNFRVESHDKERERKRLELRHKQVWDTDELGKDFTVRSFLAPFVMVTRKSDGKTGTLMFQHSPRFYFDFQEA